MGETDADDFPFDSEVPGNQKPIRFRCSEPGGVITIQIKRPDIQKLDIGDTLWLPLSVQSGKIFAGRVVYVHPGLHFFTVEFLFDSGIIRESYNACGPMFPSDDGNRSGQEKKALPGNEQSAALLSGAGEPCPVSLDDVLMQEDLSGSAPIPEDDAWVLEEYSGKAV